MAALHGTPADRAEFTRKVSLDVDGFRRAMTVMEGLYERAERTNRPGGMRLTGDGGEGKTFILEKFLQAHPPVENTMARTCPVVLLTFSGRPSISDILLSILLTLGYPVQMIRTQKNSDLQKIAVSAMVSCKVRVLIFDEAQHLWVSSSSRSQRPLDRIGGQVGEFLKLLYDQSGVAYVFAGTNGLKDAFNLDAQASTRWPGNVQLYPFKNDDYFRETLRVLDHAMPMESSSRLNDERLASRIFDSTQGNFRRLKSLISEAVYLSASEGAKSVSERHLAKAYFQLIGDEQTPFGEYMA